MCLVMTVVPSLKAERVNSLATGSTAIPSPSSGKDFTLQTGKLRPRESLKSSTTVTQS